jgi:hypothetical protein
MSTVVIQQQIMQRSSFQTVSHDLVPILIPAGNSASDGQAYVAPAPEQPDRAQITDVRRVDERMFVELKKRVSKEDWKRVGGTQMLCAAEKKRDVTAALQAYALLKESLHGRDQSPDAKKAGVEKEIDSHFFALSKMVKYGHAQYIEHAMSLLLSGARLVPWIPRDSRTREIAIYCPDGKTALAAKYFLGDWRICPLKSCQKTFIAKIATQSCCCVAHREAHRLVRWRNQKRDEQRAQKREAKRGGR